jgi:FkbM family methyltransferase
MPSVLDLKNHISQLTPDNPMLRGWSSYSQCDEDGIIRYCLNRISERVSLSRTFVEIGCGDGLENNTHQLLLDGYAGIWVDGSTTNIGRLSHDLGGVFFGKLLVVAKEVDVDNSTMLAGACSRFLGAASIDFLSIDIDGNDEHVCGPFVAHLNPKLVCVEYNAKFPPPTRLTMRCSGSHAWSGGDYFGSSLQAWVDFFTAIGFRLVCCNLSGANAFFVRSDLASAFTLYSVDELYQPARYHLIAERSKGVHAPTLKWLEQVLASSEGRSDARAIDTEVLVAKAGYGDMLVYRADSVIGKSLIEHGSFQENKIAEVANFLLDRFNFTASTFVDIGANIGTHTIYALLELGFERGICFEPDEKNFDLLFLNTARSELAGRVELNRIALSDRVGSYEMELSDTNYGDHRVKASSASVSFGEETERRYVSVPVTTLDDYVSRNAVDWSKALVWMDTQGHEGHVLAGGSGFFSSKVRPGYVVAEFWPYGIERAAGFERYFAFLAQCDTVYDVNRVENGSFKPVTVDELKELYAEMLGRTEKEVHPHTDLLLIL